MMIRKQVVFKPVKDIEIPYNYQYDVMKNIYYYISIADDVLSRRLHNKGYTSDTGHVYKLFNYSLLFEGAKFDKENIKCNVGTTIKLIISGKSDIVKKVLKGVLHVKKIKIDNVEVPLNDIQSDKKVFFKPIMLYSAFSPIVESTKDDNNSITYLTPYEGDYYKNLAMNAKRKYNLIYNQEYEENIFFDIDENSMPKQKYVQIKKGGVKGFQYDLWIEADPKMQKIIYYLGLGQNSSIGCGCLNFVTGVDTIE